MNSHVKALERKKGASAVRELERRYGAPVRFRNSEDVPVREEVRIIEHVLDIMAGTPVPDDRRAFEAGRLHFRNFSTTPLARILLPPFRNQFKLLMMQAKNIAGHVFGGVRFSSTDLGPASVKIVMENNDYPIDHFRGLFQEWMAYSGHAGTVTARTPAPGVYEYVIRWK